jgi:hypothetical protein
LPAKIVERRIPAAHARLIVTGLSQRDAISVIHGQGRFIESAEVFVLTRSESRLAADAPHDGGKEMITELSESRHRRCTENGNDSITIAHSGAVPPVGKLTARLHTGRRVRPKTRCGARPAR